MKCLRVIWSDEGGLAMLLVVFATLLLATLGLTMIAVAGDEQQRSAQASKSDTSFGAAEAGINDYIAKLVDDSLYYAHYVHEHEATRRAADGTTVAAGGVWTSGLTWTYPNGKDAWREVSNDYEYDLQITPPTAGSKALTILATGKPKNTTANMRSVEVVVRPASVADFQMMANEDITYGDTATTFGKIYAGIDSSGNRHDVRHFGTAYADIYAEGDVGGSPVLMNGAKAYDRNTIRGVIKDPVNFNSFLTSISDIQRAAQYGGVELKDPIGPTPPDAWRLTFQPNGTFVVQECLRVGMLNIAAAVPDCGPPSAPVTVPTNGAIYSDKTVIVSGQVKGRVTVASGEDIVVGDDISYVTSGEDVLGLVGKNNVYVPVWAPNDLTWRAATIAQTGQWRSFICGTTTKGTMTFNGSSATNDGGCMDMFRDRVYQYDDTLLYLPPPWFPRVEEAYTILSFREVPAA